MRVMAAASVNIAWPAFANTSSRISLIRIAKPGTIDDLESFSYRDFLLAHGFTDERYRSNILAFPPVIPIAKEYFGYQWREVNALFREFKRYAQELKPDVPMSSNSPFYWAEFMYAVERA